MKYRKSSLSLFLKVISMYQNSSQNSGMSEVILLRLSITCGLKNSKIDRQMRFSLPSLKCSAGPPSSRLLSSTVSLSELCTTIDLITALDSSRTLGGPAEHLIDGSKKCICRLSFEFQSPHIIERRSNNSNQSNTRRARFALIAFSAYFAERVYEKYSEPRNIRTSTLKKVVINICKICVQTR